MRPTSASPLRSGLAAAAVLTLFGVGAAAPAGAASAKPKSPTCASVSTKLVKKELGGDPAKPTEQSAPNVLICNYRTVDVIYLLHQSQALFVADQRENKGTAVKGIGQAAFTYGPAASRTLQVLDGSVAFGISGTTAPASAVAALAKAMLPLV